MLPSLPITDKEGIRKAVAYILMDCIRDSNTNAVICLPDSAAKWIANAIDALADAKNGAKTELALSKLPTSILHKGGIKQSEQKFYLNIRPSKKHLGEAGNWQIYYQRHHDKRASKIVPMKAGDTLENAAYNMYFYLKNHTDLLPFS